MNYHRETEHSYKSVRMNGGFLDWATQPSAFKIYPKFYPRFKLEGAKALDSTILLASKITYEKRYGNDAYFLRVWPSAGALYPVELYVQIRSVEGYIDGIYHFEVQSESLVLLHELNGDGLERSAAIGYDVKGALFIFSSPYFRSSWKYKNRAFRYCLLDSGHHYGALEFAAYANGFEAEAVFDFDKLRICDLMGFENKEFAMMFGVMGEKCEQKSRAMFEKLPFVCATDYFEENALIEEAYDMSAVTEHLKTQRQKTNFCFDKTALTAAIESRRSIRAFYGNGISKEEFEHIFSAVASEELDIFLVVNNVDGIQSGLYNEGKLIKSGDFSAKAGYLCLDQALGSHSAVTIFMASSAERYQEAVMEAGIYGHRLYIFANILGIGVSGIGAYYDGETKEFLGTDKHILYALAIGR